MNKQTGKKRKGAGAFLARRQFKYGGFAILLTAVVIAAVILLNIAVGAIETNWGLSIDVTSNKVTDFDQATYDVLAGFDEPVSIYTVYQNGSTSPLRYQVEDVIEKYRAKNKNITVDNIDPVSEPLRVTKYAGDTALTEGAIIVTNGDESRVKLIDRTEYYRTATSSYTGGTYTVFDVEPKLTGALLYVTSKETPRVFFLTGHGETDAEASSTLLIGQLESDNYDVATLNLIGTDVVLAPGDVVVIDSPRRDLTDDEYTILMDWIVTGGRMYINMDYTADASVLVNLFRLLDYYQLGYDEGYIEEDQSSTANWVQATYMLVPNMDAEHEITADLNANDRYLMVLNARPIKKVDFPESGLQYTTLLSSSAKSVVVQGDGTSDPASYPVAMSMLKQNYEDPSKDVRIVLTGGSGMLADNYMMMNYSYIRYFLFNAFDWLVNREVNVSISGKLVDTTVLSIPDAATAWTLAAIVVIAIPLLVAVCGVVVWIRRRRL